MPNFAAALKEEIRRLAKKEARAETGKTKLAVARYHREITSLKQQLKDQAKKIARLTSGQGGRSVAPAAVVDNSLEGLRFSARSVRAQRKRLNLSAEDFGKLVGVSGLTIYHWEHGKARPRKAQFASLVKVRLLKKRQAMAQLEDLKASEGEG